MTVAEINNARKLLSSKGAGEFLEMIQVWCGPTRFKILLLLSRYGQGFTVTELAKVLNASLSRISHQLRILKRHHLVSAKGQNRETVYKITNQLAQKHLSSYLTRL